jgi:two-component system CheB/CheR fusion protein
MARLKQFFVKDEHTYRVQQELRDTVVFAQQNLIADPPFSRLNVISCRNLLIYIEPPLQERIIGLLHFALVEGGHLFLGSAESIAAQEDSFAVVSAKYRIYRRIGPTRNDRVQFPVTMPRGALPERRSPTVLNAARLATLVQQQLLERYIPPA